MTPNIHTCAFIVCVVLTDFDLKINLKSESWSRIYTSDRLIYMKEIFGSTSLRFVLFIFYTSVHALVVGRRHRELQDVRKKF